jgi:aminopeptidase N
LKIKFNSKIGESLIGFYKSKNNSEKNDETDEKKINEKEDEEKVYATQFEATECRMAFPCCLQNFSFLNFIN